MPGRLEGARFAQDEPKQRGGVEVGDHLDERSWRRADRLSVGLGGLTVRPFPPPLGRGTARA
jgi:hypothetical protein